MADEYQYESKPLPDPGLGRFGLGDPTSVTSNGFFSEGGKMQGYTPPEPNAMPAPSPAPEPTTGLPSGSAGDILYHNGTIWVVKAKPTGMTENPVLRFNLSTNVPYWDEPGCE